MNDIKNLNEAFERMFKEALDDETLSHVFDEEYASVMSEIEEDNAAMQKMYDTGNVSPADALNALGYIDADEETLTSESIIDGVTYTKVFHFNDDFTHEYYVLQDGKIPSGWTVTKSAVDDEVLDRLIGKLSEKLEEIESRINEAEISDEDKRDSDLIRSMINKIQARSNAAFTPEEKAVMDKYNIKRHNWAKKLNVDDRDLNPDLDGTRSFDWRDGGHYQRNGTPSKINYADRARKLSSRKANQIAGDGSSTYYQNRDYNKHGASYSLIDKERAIENDKARQPIRDMQRALNDRKYYQDKIDNADSKRAAALAAAQKAYDFAKAQADRAYEWDTVDAAKSKDNAQNRIDQLLKKDIENESLNESMSGKWSTIAYDLVDDMGTDNLRDFSYALIKWLSDTDVGEFLHQNDYIPYSDEE